MGLNPSKVKVLTLNTSSINLNPFEYYGQSNWEQLQKIGLIFEQNLKNNYKYLKQINKLDQKIYDRDKFVWNTGQIDKLYQGSRYTPIYKQNQKISKINKNQSINYEYIGKEQISTELYLNQIQFQPNDDLYAGLQIQRSNPSALRLINQVQFMVFWHQYLYEIKSKQEKMENKAKVYLLNQNQINCKYFDFYCYKSIVQYLAIKIKLDSSQSGQILKNLFKYEDMQLDDIIKAIYDKQQKEHYQQWYDHEGVNYMDLFARYYKKFMDQIFKQIDVENRIQLLEKFIFKQNQTDIVCFQNVNSDLETRLLKMAETYSYHFIGPDQKDDESINLILIKKNEGILQCLNQKTKTSAFKKGKNDLQNNVQNDYQNKEIDRSDALLKNIQKNISPHKYAFYIYWLKRIQQQKYEKQQKMIKILNKIQQNGFFSWNQNNQNILLAHLYNKQKNETLVVCNCHFGTDKGVNDIQVSIIGLMIYYFQVQKIKYIFSGDFNSYLTSVKTQNEYSFLDFVQSPNGLKQTNISFDIAAKLSIYPKHPKLITAKNKRSILQVQSKKVNKLTQACLDQIITCFKIDDVNSHISQIQQIGTNIQNNSNLLPNLTHPFHHFILQGVILTDAVKTQVNKNDLKVITLNYSGIYLNPFEYFNNSENESLQEIGQILNKQMKKKNIQKWQVGQIDKSNQTQRYTPLYCQIKNFYNNKFAGIKEGNLLQNQQQFIESWNRQFQKITKKYQSGKKYDSTKYNQQVKSCMNLDLTCYKSIIIYLNGVQTYQNKKTKKQQQKVKPIYKYIQFDQAIQNFNKSQVKGQIYIQFMKKMFKIIDPKKQRYLIEANIINQLFDVICLQQSNQQLLKSLESPINHFMYHIYKLKTLNSEGKQDANSILLVKRGFLQPSVKSFLEDDAKDNEVNKGKQPQLMTIWNPLKYTNDHFKSHMEEKLNNSYDTFLKYWNNKIDQRAKIMANKKDLQKELTQMKTYLKDLKNNGMLYWADHVIFSEFKRNQEKIVLACVHLSSKQHRNCIEISIIGLIMIYLLSMNIDFVFSGDFNSEIVFEDTPYNQIKQEKKKKEKQQKNKMQKQKLYNIFGVYEQSINQKQTKQRAVFDKLKKSINKYPNDNRQTTKKKRTYLQPQNKKANQMAQKQIDQIITNLPINFEKSFVGQIEDIPDFRRKGFNKNKQLPLIPHDKHPYDHFVIIGRVLLDQQEK